MFANTILQVAVPGQEAPSEKCITVKKSFIGEERIFFINSPSMSISVPANTVSGIKQVHSILMNLIDRGTKFKFVNTSYREIAAECISEITASVLDQTIERITGQKIDMDTLGAVLCDIKRKERGNAGNQGIS